MQASQGPRLREERLQWPLGLKPLCGEVLLLLQTTSEELRGKHVSTEWKYPTPDHRNCPHPIEATRELPGLRVLTISDQVQWVALKTGREEGNRIASFIAWDFGHIWNESSLDGY